MSEWIEEKTREWEQNPGHQRLGQFLMNQLFQHDKALYFKVSNTDNDPFYNDRNIPNFKTFCAVVV